MSGNRCWCTHAKESHGPRRDNRVHCIGCENGSGKNGYFLPEHLYRPIATLRPLPMFLFRENAA